MKDEEMAEEYADNYDIMNKDLSPKSPRHIVKECFLAGLKAGRPQWHDLRKDPNDLPKEDMYLEIKLNDKNTCYKYCTGFWEKDEKCFNILFCKVDTKDIIAWKEIEKMAKKELKEQLKSYEGYINDIPLVIDPCKQCKVYKKKDRYKLKESYDTGHFENYGEYWVEGACKSCCWYYDSKFEMNVN